MSGTYTRLAPTIFSTRNSRRPLRMGASLCSTGADCITQYLVSTRYVAVRWTWEIFMRGVWPWLVILLLLIAAVWALKRQRRALVDRATASRTRRALAEMSWPEVEQAIHAYVRGRDFEVGETERAQADSAPDLLVTRLNEYYLVRS